MIFSNATLQEYFENNGYITAEFLSPDEISFLSDVYTQYDQMGGSPIDFAKDLNYHISAFDTNTDRRVFIDQKLKSVFGSKIKDILPGYRILTSNFMIKYPGDGEIEVHQDFSHVDEKIYTAFNLWCPLQDTTPENGGFFLIRNSNKLFNSYRSATIPHNLTHYNDVFKKLMEPVPVKAGSGLLFDHRLFHYSTPNTTPLARIAVQMVVIPAEATPVLYEYNPQQNKTKLNIYELTEEFLLTKNMWEGTKDLKCIGTAHYEKIPDTAEILGKLGVSIKKPNLIKRILGYV